MILVLVNVPIHEITQMEPMYAGDFGSGRSGYMLILEMNIAFIFGWAPVLGVIPNASLKQNGKATGPSDRLFHDYGLVYLHRRDDRPGHGQCLWLVQHRPHRMAAVARRRETWHFVLVFIGFANITTQAIATYSLTVSTKVINPKWNYKVIATLWSVFCAALVVWNGVWEYYTLFLALVGAVCVPVVTLIIVDFYIVRRKRFSMRSLYLVDGKDPINIPAASILWR